MADNCGTCFFYRSTTGTCHALVPQSMNGGAPGWPPVKSSDWCGRGANLSTLASFSTGITGEPASPDITVEPAPQSIVVGAPLTYSTSAPSGGNNGDMWIRENPAGTFTLSQKAAGAWSTLTTWISA